MRLPHTQAAAVLSVVTFVGCVHEEEKDLQKGSLSPVCPVLYSLYTPFSLRLEASKRNHCTSRHVSLSPPPPAAAVGDEEGERRPAALLPLL